ncbi:hypothetical protein C8R46DRAFT_1196760 [Mycena filopes]|nr:hypothetical protein C8R46DRAFT_1196760 [Mycena filopes]
MTSTNPTARPPKAPPMTSMPSTPGPEIPGGYPRNSVVFASNQWDRSAKSKKPGMFAAAKNYLPPVVASYFPKTPSTPTPGTDALAPPPPLNRGSSAVSDNFSTRAYAGSQSSRDTSTPMQPAAAVPEPTAAGSHASPEIHNPYFPRVPPSAAAPPPAAKPVAEKKADGVLPLPSVAPFASILTSTGSKLPPPPPPPADAHADSSAESTPNSHSTSSPQSASTAPSSASPASPESPAKKTRFAVEEGGASPKSGSSSSRFASTLARLGSVRKGHGRARSEGDALPAASPATGAAPATTANGGVDELGALPANGGKELEGKGSKPKRTGSLMRTLRGEATVLAGRVRGDRARVERGRRMVHPESEDGE